MSPGFRLWLMLLTLLILCTGNYGPSAAQAGKSRFTRLGSLSPRVGSQSTKDQVAKDEPAPRSNSKVKNPKRIPTLDEMILFQPSGKGDWAPQNLSFSDVNFESADGTKLHAWYCPADKPRAVVLYCHGNAGNIAWMTDFF